MSVDQCPHVVSTERQRCDLCGLPVCTPERFAALCDAVETLANAETARVREGHSASTRMSIDSTPAVTARDFVRKARGGS